jgi:hypothetical protein
MNLKNNKIFILVILFCFLFRLFFGFYSQFWFVDEFQVYLLGLKFFTTELWPYFGPDIVYIKSQLPGALQALLVGGPFFIFKSPLSPYIFLNILSFLGLSFLAIYCVKLTSAPKWIVCLWIFLSPWTLNFSTHILNPSYVLFPSILFFIAFFETIPSFRINFIKTNFSFAIMGFSFFYIYQLHMSWVVLVPVIGYSFLKNSKTFKIFCKNSFFFILGAIPMFILVIPTYLKYGFLGTGQTEQNIIFNINNFSNFFKIFLRTFSFSSFEVARFIGHNTESRINFALNYFWAIPFILFGFLMGFFQTLFLIYKIFTKNDLKGWQFIKYFLIIMIFIVYFMFFFSIKGPSAHTFYLLIPVVFIYSFYSFKKYLKLKIWKRLAYFTILSSIIFHISIAIDGKKKRSIFSKRDNTSGFEKVAKALNKKNYKILGERRFCNKNKKNCF